LGRAFNPSVLFMMAMPFLVVGAIAGGLVYAYRRAQHQTGGQNQPAATGAESPAVTTQVGSNIASTQIQ
jgi:hypothetical protein